MAATTLCELIYQIDATIANTNKHEFMTEAQSCVQNYEGIDWTLFKPCGACNRCTRNKNEYCRMRITLPKLHGRVYDMYLLVFPPGIVSAYHDHPANGCVLRVLEGTIEEDLISPQGNNPQTTRLHAGDVSYMHDSVGYHRIRNPSQTQTAYSLHIYSPVDYVPNIIFLDDLSSCQSSD